MHDDIAVAEARRAIQERLNASIEADRRKVFLDIIAPDFTVRLLSGEVLDRQQFQRELARDWSEIISHWGRNPCRDRQARSGW